MSHSRHTRRFPQVLIASLSGALQIIKPGHYSHTHTQTQTNENNAHTHILTPSHTHTLTLSRTGKDTETQTHGHRHTETNTHTHRETNTHTHTRERTSPSDILNAVLHVLPSNPPLCRGCSLTDELESWAKAAVAKRHCLCEGALEKLWRSGYSN